MRLQQPVPVIFSAAAITLFAAAVTLSAAAVTLSASAAVTVRLQLPDERRDVLPVQRYHRWCYLL